MNILRFKGLAILILTTFLSLSTRATDHGTIDVNVGETAMVKNSMDESFLILSWDWTKNNDNIQWVSKQFNECKFKGVNANTYTTLTFNGHCLDRNYYSDIYDNETWTIHVIQPVTGIKLDETSASLQIGEKKKLNATIMPTDATYKDVEWTSANPEVATVNSSGEVTAVGDGTTTIWCTHTKQKNKWASCIINVNQLRDWSFFTARTIEGVEMKFYVYFVEDGECEVAGPQLSPSIEKNTMGHITIPSEVRGLKVTKLHDCAFSGCEGITSVSIPSSISTIGSSVFRGCTSLASVTIPSSVISIGGSVFDGCNNLKYVYSFITNPFAIDNNVFEGISSEAILYVPIGTKHIYESTTGWNNHFKSIVEFNPTLMRTPQNDKKTGTTIYDLNGYQMEKPHKGINIIDGKKVVVR